MGRVEREQSIKTAIFAVEKKKQKRKPTQPLKGAVPIQ